MNPPIHSELAAGRWHEFPLSLQLAHIGSEVSRACTAKRIGNDLRMQSAFHRMLELFDLTITDPKNRYRLREICRAREVLCDFFAGDNVYQSTDTSLNRYFLQFAMSSKQHRSDASF